MALDYAQFLRDKFVEGFQEANEAFGKNLPLQDHLKEISDYIQKEKKLNSPSGLVQMKDCCMELNDALSECIRIQEDRRPRKSLIGSSKRRDLWLLVKTWRKLRGIRRKLLAMKEDPSGAHDDDHQHSAYSSIYVLDKDDFSVSRGLYHGLDEQVEKIWDLLQGGERKQAIAIVGMGGSGKTALAREVFSRSNSYFDTKVWINLSEVIDIEKKYECIVSSHFPPPPPKINNDVDHGYNSIVGIKDFLEILLHPWLSNYMVDKTCLIVLDGVWHATDEMKKLVGMILGSNKSSLIITTRIEGVAKSLVADHDHTNFYLHRVEPLSPDDC